MRPDDGLRALFRERLPQVHWTSVETGGTGRGIPDSNGCLDGCEFWVEYKAEESMGAVGLRPEQIAWIHRRQRAGGRVWVAVRLRHAGGPRKGPPTDELWLLGGDPRVLRRDGLTPGAEWVAGRWSGGPSGWLWDSILGVLLS